MKIYIAGKITGDKDFAQKFAKIQAGIEAQGHTALNPAELPAGMSQADYMKICFAMIDCADAVLMLLDWKESKGACLEWNYCTYIGKRVLYCEERKQTNADRIRSMTDEELEDFIRKVAIHYEPWCDKHCKMNGDDDCNNCLAKWLKQPSDKGENENA